MFYEIEYLMLNKVGKRLIFFQHYQRMQIMIFHKITYTLSGSTVTENKTKYLNFSIIMGY